MAGGRESKRVRTSATDFRNSRRMLPEPRAANGRRCPVAPGRSRRTREACVALWARWPRAGPGPRAPQRPPRLNRAEAAGPGHGPRVLCSILGPRPIRALRAT
ncbi:hypothetical protein LUTEI9C_140027 [Luteimonas sp. 9C]|nr:hypothetical protein LUTEI9C_140027 [Luteimonas sp. 9C]